MALVLSIQRSSRCVQELVQALFLIWNWHALYLDLQTPDLRQENRQQEHDVCSLICCSLRFFNVPAASAQNGRPRLE